MPTSGQRDDVPRPEYPRPHFDRSDRWTSLNGPWQFTPEGSVESRPITVPFAWETAASGVGVHWLERARYRRTFTVPDDWADDRVVLHFGAVHHHARVSVDGTPVGEHEGGYVPFAFDVTDALGTNAEHEVVVDVHAPADKRGIAHGKQRSTPRDDYDSCAFTPSSGIWQSVWLEPRPATHLAHLALRPTTDLDGITVTGDVDGPAAADAEVELTVSDAGSATTLATRIVDASALATGVVLELAEPHRWEPDDPHLYDVTVRVTSTDGHDRVVGHTGLRTIETRGAEIFLNGRRIALRGVLDQGYWPRTGITAPTEDAFLDDLRIARAAGFNTVRKHLKTEDPLFLHHADREGMLVWAEPASTGRFSDAAAEAFAAQVEPMVERDGDHPSIVVWGLYNEEWGLDWALPDDPRKQEVVREAYRALRALDPTRPVVDNSGWTHLETDLVDWHVYDEHPVGWARKVADLVQDDRPVFPVAIAVDSIVDKELMIDRPVPRDVPFLNSEFGGGWTSIDRGWNLHWQTQELRRHDGIAGWVWTELADVEHESAGIVSADRSWKDDGGRPPAHVNGETAVVFDLLPEAPGRDLVAPDGVARLGIQVSHHGPAAIDLDVTYGWGAVFGLAVDTPSEQAGTVHVEPFVLSPSVSLSAQLPAGRERGRLHVLLRDGDRIVGRGAVDVVRD